MRLAGQVRPVRCEQLGATWLLVSVACVRVCVRERPRREGRGHYVTRRCSWTKRDTVVSVA